ncbi:MAG: phage integrase N-terminal SAM-like domain-containing protein [Bacteroidetes bacterium]|nr:phage integrase N-terminal SAM-like domain-containing protein [Bacteroidota bacterium]
MNTEKAYNYLKEELTRRDYAPQTIKAYCDWVTKLGEFYSNRAIDSLGQAEISEYLTHLNVRLKVAPSSINQAFQSYQQLFNKLLEKNINFSKIEKPERKRSNPDILTTEEIVRIIEGTSNLKHKLIIAIAYSSGLEKGETKNLRISDVDIQRNVIKIKDTKGRIKREAILAKYVKGMYLKHLKENNPKRLVFESGHTGEHYGDTTLGKILTNQATKVGITKKITFKTLKYSFVVHSHQLGRPLSYTLDDLKMKSSQSLEFFSNIVNRGIPNRAFSPLDKIALQTEVEYPINREYIEQSILGIKNKDEADYLKEALMCMTSGSLRAGIIFSWNAAILNLRKKCFNHGKVSLNKALQNHYNKAKEIKKIEDFSYIQDALLLKAAQELGEIDKGEKDALEDCLDTRNKCGHPGKYKPKALKAASFMEELITIVFKRNN